MNLLLSIKNARVPKKTERLGNVAGPAVAASPIYFGQINIATRSAVAGIGPIKACFASACIRTEKKEGSRDDDDRVKTFLGCFPISYVRTRFF